MVTIEHKDQVVNIAVLGEFTLADYKQLEEEVEYRIRTHGRVDLLFDLRDMLGYTLDVAWEEFKFSRQHAHDFGRIAVVTRDQWVAWSTWINRAFMDADIELFEAYDDALDWLRPSPPEPSYP